MNDPHDICIREINRLQHERDELRRMVEEHAAIYHTDTEALRRSADELRAAAEELIDSLGDENQTGFSLRTHAALDRLDELARVRG